MKIILKRKPPEPASSGTVTGRITLKKPNTGPAWTSNEIAAFLLQSMTDRALQAKYYRETFGVDAPETDHLKRHITAWGLRCAVFYEQLKRCRLVEGKPIDDDFKKRHAVALTFGVASWHLPNYPATIARNGNSEPPDGKARSAQIMNHSCGHRVIRAVSYDEMKAVESMPCPACAPSAAKKDSQRMIDHVGNHATKPQPAPPRAKQREDSPMTKKKTASAPKPATAKSAAPVKAAKGRVEKYRPPVKGKADAPRGRGNPGTIGPSGMNKKQFIVETFRKNESAKTRLTDAALQTAFNAEFKKSARPNTVAVEREKLNRGGFGSVGFKSTEYAPKGTKAAAPAKAAAIKAPAKVKAAPAPATASAAAPARKIKLVSKTA